MLLQGIEFKLWSAHVILHSTSSFAYRWAHCIKLFSNNILVLTVCLNWVLNFLNLVNKIYDDRIVFAVFPSGKTSFKERLISNINTPDVIGLLTRKPNRMENMNINCCLLKKSNKNNVFPYKLYLSKERIWSSLCGGKLPCCSSCKLKYNEKNYFHKPSLHLFIPFSTTITILSKQSLK